MTTPVPATAAMATTRPTNYEIFRWDSLTVSLDNQELLARHKHHRTAVGVVLLLLAVCCLIVSGSDLLIFPSDFPNLKAHKLLNATFTLLSLAGIMMFLYSIMWLC
ncbi:hypothetical protein LSAT2_020693 [Lamellibrachia satsuma]|nr:hypothetical protein LSAT2_020693 [Lamellibrachia satsuma]